MPVFKLESNGNNLNNVSILLLLLVKYFFWLWGTTYVSFDWFKFLFKSICSLSIFKEGLL